MISIREAVIVEGKYDKIKLKGFIDAPIIVTNGFRIFKDKEKRELIRRAAETRGLVIMTDSDSAGFIIRNHLKGIVPAGKLCHCYVPQILGKEKRKSKPSKEGLLGVEGIDEKLLLDALQKSGAHIIGSAEQQKTAAEITKQDLYEMGLVGRENSAVKRREFLIKTGLPAYLTANSLLDAVNILFSKQEMLDLIFDSDKN